MCFRKKKSVIPDVTEMANRAREIQMATMWSGRRLFELGLGSPSLKCLLYELPDSPLDSAN